jgi:CDP-glucose 4,6-dehydratase
MGIANSIPSKPSNFKVLNLNKKIKCKKIDIRDSKKLLKVIKTFKPDYIFHLAAEAIVKRAYENPKRTWEINTIGTINILESLKQLKNNVASVIITSDKVYKNFELNRGYKENDILGGLDPYSASKAAADYAVQSYINNGLSSKKNLKIAIARAGNVIGGGDWSFSRIIPDCVRSWSKNKPVKIRNPNSTRPWQHVLDVLYGYIILAVILKKNKKVNGEAFNFGPRIEKKREVINVVKAMQKYWPRSKIIVKKEKIFKESKLLQLNSAKAKKILKWNCNMNLKQTINLTINWYKKYYFSPQNLFSYSMEQIKNYENSVKK